MSPKEIRREGEDWIYRAQSSDKWEAPLNILITFGAR